MRRKFDQRDDGRHVQDRRGPSHERRRSESHVSPRRDGRPMSPRREDRHLQRRESLHAASPDSKKRTMMSSVVAVVKNDNQDEYNPMKMLKKSISSKVEV